VAGDKSALDPPTDENKNKAREGQHALTKLLDNAFDQMVPCPECSFLVFEWWQACPRCGLLASAVSEEHMQRLREGRNDESWQLDIFTFASAIANAGEPRTTKAIANGAGGNSDPDEGEV
jgi:hypothetical protein